MVPSARIWGKRHLYLLGTVVLVFSSAWGGASKKNYKSLLAARIFQGIALAPFEALVNASVGDLYHVHQRGKRMALTNLALFGGAFFTPVLVGKIADTMGYKWTFYFVAIFSGALLPVVVFFVPETAFRRDAHFNTDTATSTAAGQSPDHERAIEVKSNEHVVPSSASESLWDSEQHMNRGIQKEMGAEHCGTTPPPPPPRTSWAQSLIPFNGRKTDDKYLHLLLRPFPLFFHPGILWVRYRIPSLRCCLSIY
jgi:MFS family permease